jgi:E3 ubiquitin-protein ligase CCNP1IP1
MGHVQKAASEAVEHTIQASVTSNRYVDHFGNSHEQQHRSPIFPSLQGMAMAPPQAPTGISPSGIIDRNGSRMGWNNVGSQGSSQGGNQGTYFLGLW